MAAAEELTQEFDEQAFNALYERFALPLEVEHHGKFVAVMPDGRYVMADTLHEVIHEAIARLGPGGTIYQLGPRVPVRFGP